MLGKSVDSAYSRGREVCEDEATHELIFGHGYCRFAQILWRTKKTHQGGSKSEGVHGSGIQGQKVGETVQETCAQVF